MNGLNERELLMWVWSDESLRSRVGMVSDESIAIRNFGRCVSPETGVAHGVEIVSDGSIRCGDAFFCNDAQLPERPESVVVQIVGTRPSPPLVRYDGKTVPQLRISLPPELGTLLDSLALGAEDYACGELLQSMRPAERIALFDQLFTERLERKCSDVERIFRECGNDWNETLYAMMFRYVGGSRNAEAFMQLARLVPYGTLVHLGSRMVDVEALLLGAAGLLKCCYFDDYVSELQKEADFLCKKYNLYPMDTAYWDVHGTYPVNRPLMQIVRLAAFFGKNEFIFREMMRCRSREDVSRLFDTEISSYWREHCVPDGNFVKCPSSFGVGKRYMLGINVVAPLMFAYGKFTHNQKLCDQAIGVVASLPVENNAIVRGWSAHGIPLQSAWDSQAVIQLRREYCDRGRCFACKLGRMCIKKSMNGVKVE